MQLSGDFQTPLPQRNTKSRRRKGAANAKGRPALQQSGLFWQLSPSPFSFFTRHVPQRGGISPLRVMLLQAVADLVRPEALEANKCLVQTLDVVAGDFADRLH